MFLSASCCIPKRETDWRLASGLFYRAKYLCLGFWSAGVCKMAWPLAGQTYLITAVLGSYKVNCGHGSNFRSSAFLKKVDNFTSRPVVLFSCFVSTLCSKSLVLLPAMADSCAWEVLNDQAIFTSLSSVRANPLLISFSLALGELVPNSIRSQLISSECLISQFWAIKDARMRRPVMNL